MAEEGQVLGPALVTGASGFIGRHLVRALLQQERQVFALCRRPHPPSLCSSNPLLQVVPGDLLDSQSYTPHLNETVVVFHLAAVRNQRGLTPERYSQVNEAACLELARTAARTRVKRFVYVSSAVVFGPSHGRPVSEADGLNNDITTSCYIRSRVQSLRGMNKLVESGLPLVTLCPTIVFGPDHPANPNRITSQMRRLLRTGLDVVIAGGHQKRNLVFVNDVVRGILQAEKMGGRGECLILGGEDISYRDLNQRVLSMAGRKPRMSISIPAGMARSTGKWADRILGRHDRAGLKAAIDVLIQEWEFSSRKAEEVLGYRRTPLGAAVEKTLQFIQSEAA